MKLKTFLTFTIAILIILFQQGCKKDVISESKLIGKWSGISKITKISTTDPYTNQLNVFSDTILCSLVSGNTFSLEFQKDKLTILYDVNFNQVTGTEINYNLKGNRLTFSLNPFTLRGASGFEPTPRTSIISSLTNKKLFLYDIDTIPSQALIVNEVTFEFEK